MVRDPTSAYAYWDLSDGSHRCCCRGSRSPSRAFLRLIGVPSGYLLAEHAVPAERGSQEVALPEADSSYMVELAVMHNYQWVVLARSDVIHAPPETARAASTPAFVSRAPQLRLPAEGHDRELDRAGGDLVAAPTGVATRVAQAAGGAASVGALPHAGSEARLLRAASEFRSLRSCAFARSGSEARLTRREPARIPFVVAGSPAMTEPVAAALGALAAAVWFGRIRSTCSAPETCWSVRWPKRGSAGPAVAVLDPPGPDVAPPEPAGPDTSSSGTEVCTVSEGADGSVTVIDRDGNSITYSPVHSPASMSPRTRSAAAIVGVRHAL